MPSGNSTLMFLRLLPRAPARRIEPRFGDASRTVPPCAAAAGQVIARQAFRARRHFGRRALKDDASAAIACSGADFHHAVGGPDHRLFVFDGHDRVAPIAELLHGVHQAIDVGGVQADRRLVQHVEHVHQARTEGRRECHTPRSPPLSVRKVRSSVR